MTHELILHRIDESTFRAENGFFNSGPIPESKLHLVASAYSGFDKSLNIKSNCDKLATRFSQLVQRYTSNEFMGVPKPIINHLINLSKIDRYDFEANKGTGKGASAVIVGAGPSASKNLQQAIDSGHTVIACGSAIPLMARKGLKPDVALALDPNDLEIARFENLPKEWADVPLIYKGRLHPEALKLWPGKKVWVPGTGWKGASQWEGTNECFPGHGIGVSTWSMELSRYLGFDNIYLIGFDLGRSEDGKLYSEELADCEHHNDANYQDFRNNSFQDERVTLEGLFKELNLNVFTTSTELEGTTKIDSIPKADKKWEVTLKHFNRKYWKRLKKGAKDMIKSIEVLERKQRISLPEVQALSITNHLLQPQIHIAANKYRVLGTLDLTAFIDTCKELKPLLKRI